MLGCVPNGAWSAGRMPIARSGTTIPMPLLVMAGVLLGLLAPGVGPIGRWSGSIRCASAYSSHATLASGSPGIRRANFFALWPLLPLHPDRYSTDRVHSCDGVVVVDRVT